MCHKRRSVPVVGRVWRGSTDSNGNTNTVKKTSPATSPATATATATAAKTSTTTAKKGASTVTAEATATVTETATRSGGGTKSHQSTLGGGTAIDTKTRRMIATALAAAVHVDFDQHGRPSGDIASVAEKNDAQVWDVDAHRRADALIKLGAISRRRSAVCAGDYVSTDLCGRGDPAIFARMRRTGAFASDSTSTNHATDHKLSIDHSNGCDNSAGNAQHLAQSDLDAIANAQLHRQPTELPSINPGDDDEDTDAEVNGKLALPQVKSERRASRSKNTRERLRRTKSHQFRHSKQPLYKNFTKWFTSRRRHKAP